MTCCHSNSSERPSTNTDVKNSRNKIVTIELVGKVIRRELCKKFEFNHKKQWLMHDQETEMHNIH